LDTALAEGRKLIAERLRARREELERAIATRVFAISEPSETADPAYLQGLRDSLTVAVDHALAAIELGERRTPDTPPSLLIQARLAARNGVGVDTVVRRYTAGYALIVDFILKQVQEAPGISLRRLLNGQAAVFDRLIQDVSEEHARESARMLGSSRERRIERVRRLLAGEAIDATELEYDLEGFHLGLVATGPGAEKLVRELARKLDLRLLCVAADGEELWAWLGSRSVQALDPSRIGDCAVSSVHPGSLLTLGVEAQGVSGWRLTHRQALAALSVATYQDTPVVRYTDVSLLACIVKDELLSESLARIYLAPLEKEPDGGEALRETLRAYFAAKKNVSSAAAALRLNRQTVGNRLRVFERRVGQAIGDCSPEVETALLLEGGSRAPGAPMRSQTLPTP